MIDFRYHLVSLVSVFLALAVGIVLGAGPLKESIGEKLTSEVKDLRKDKLGLHDDLQRLEASTQNRDEFLAAVTPSLVGQRLGGRSVVVVTLPGVDGETVEPLTDALSEAGASVTARVGITKDWTAQAKASFRDQLVTQLESGIEGLDASETDTSGRLAVLLARGLVTGDIAEADKLDAPARTIVEGLRSAELITVDEDVEARATVAVLLAPPVDSAGSGTSSPVPTPAQAGGAPWRALATAVDDACDGAVVLGPASSAGEDGVLAALRDDAALSREVSTVDTAGTPMGSVTAVLALSEQLRGASGAYGFAEGADKALPELGDADPEKS